VPTTRPELAPKLSNSEIVRSLLERFVGGDLEGPFEHYSPEIEFDARHFPDGRVYRGHDGVREFMRSFFETVSDYRLEVRGIADAGDEVVVYARESGRGRGSGAAFDVTCAQVYTLRDGRVVGWRVAALV
jgi:ketosteroid isomerase-like protein